MTNYHDLIETANNAPLHVRKQFVQYMLNILRQSARKLTAEDANAFREFAYGQVDVCLKAIPEAGCYKEKDQIFELEDMILGMIMMLCPSPADIPEAQLMKIRALTAVVEEERKIETTLDSIFKQDSIQEADMNRVLYWVKQSGDEFQRSVMYAGILHYRDQLSKLSDGARAKLSEHILSEMERILAMDPPAGEAVDALEILCDVCKLFPADQTPTVLDRVFALGNNRISYYAAETLLSLNLEPSAQVIEDLAKDLFHANLIHGTLRQYGKENRFPKELNNEVYLAKSDLVHWLCYPTELGQPPEEIAYIGKIKYLFKKDVYHVFKYRSESDTLGDDLKGKWLIGWSSAEGGTFSNFDEFAKFDLGSTDKTLKNIKKKLIG